MDKVSTFLDSIGMLSLSNSNFHSDPDEECYEL